MKKKQLLALGLATAMIASMAVGCGSSDTETTDTPATEEAGEAAEGTASAGGSGKVYYLNFKPEAD